MFADIFKSKKSKEENKIKPKIICDIHEKDSLVPGFLAESKEVEYEMKNLHVGDYLVGDTIIERKTVRDFASSIISKRLISQLDNMLQYEKRILIIEGDIKNSMLNENALMGMMLSIELDFKIPIIQAKDEEETSKFLILLARKQVKSQAELTFHSRKPESKKEQIQYIIESFPNIGPKNAKKLLKKFKTVRNIISAEEKDLRKEIGKKADSIIGLRD